ncbi:winged helix-turn-helix transcriptional regulator [Mucilaginibacter sp. X4EP1]|jgi:DNA-binding HxlR family transcriptional regulator|uniref:winged helix-turn-helix transcriptional regulator n=1 Tax=Mucilaginibacter sp. X4EP1 TaxID=2723092 RepID=UPI002167D6E0|nr:helix-turn-helix domain-containing protein [Mucilaginibacter sp. X4EP1]MCS3812699.1 DNA-binding HxlR family transcriptional regulator [Mucilaginibacter sp. X4EP1]
MYEKKIPLLFDCGLTITKEVLGGKWKTSLIYAISEGILRPSELQRAIPGSTKRVLNQQLKELEEFDILSKKIYHQLPPKVEYSLTELGRTILPIIKMMNQWGEQNRVTLEPVIKARTEIPAT